MAAPYAFWIYGSNTNHQTLTTPALVTSQTEDTVAGGTLPVASTANGWLEVPAWGLSMELVREGEDYETSGLGAFNGPMAGRWQVSMMTDDYDFPDDWDAYTSLLSKINSRYIYFAVKTYADGITLHFPNHAIAIASAHKIDHDYPNGKKRLTLTFRFRYPHNDIIPA